MLTLKDILEIENTQEILKFTYPGTDYLMWPYLRNIVLRKVIYREVYGEEILHEKNMTKPYSKYLQIISCLADGLIHNLRFLKHKSNITIFSDGISNVFVNGKYFNKISDYFASCYPNTTLLLEEEHEWQHLRPRANQNVAYRSPIKISFLALGELATKVLYNKRSINKLKDFIKYLDDRLQLLFNFYMTSKQREHLLIQLYRHGSTLRQQIRLYEKIFKLLETKLIIIQGGIYGFNSHIIRLAKDMGINTAEMQHGLVSSGHSAYNFSSQILQSESYRRYVPDYFMAYGQWWKNQIRIPSKVIIIGNPHYDFTQIKYKKNSDNKRILLLSSGEKIVAYIKMAHELKKLLPGHEIILRPHPAEKSAVIKKYGKYSNGILIDHSDDLHSQIVRSVAVVGEISTALFESIGMTEKIFVMNSRLKLFWMPECPFDSFETVEELALKLVDDNSGRSGQSMDLQNSIWARDWETNYRHFISERLGLIV